MSTRLHFNLISKDDFLPEREGVRKRRRLACRLLGQRWQKRRTTRTTAKRQSNCSGERSRKSSGKFRRRREHCARQRARYERTVVLRTRSKSVFRRVGLDPDCPQFVAEQVRKAYMVRLHPDRQPVGLKAESEWRFKEAEQVFSEIWRLRGF